LREREAAARYDYAFEVGHETNVSSENRFVKVAATQFTLVRWAAAVGLVLTAIAMLIYPGGTLRDPSTRGYSLSHNFLSDLGSTVTFSGQSNSVGAVLFASGLGVLVIGFGAALVGLVSVLSESPATRKLVRAAAAFGVLVCVFFLGVALTPENRLLRLHVQATLFAFRFFPLVTLPLAFATLRDERFPRRAAVAWAALTCVLAAYVFVLQWGPRLTTDRGLMIQVVAQKIVASTAMIVMVYQSYEAGRVFARRAPRLTGDARVAGHTTVTES
jgi:hypothetical membrane protein